MHVHPVIARLRIPKPPQTRISAIESAKAVHHSWLASQDVERVRRDLVRYAAGAELADCSALGLLVSDHRSAHRFANSLFGRIIAVLRDRALAEAPFRFQVSQGLATIRLLAANRATLNLVAYEPLGTDHAPDTALFADREAHEIIVSGQGTGWELERAASSRVQIHKRQWSEGDTITTQTATEARQILLVTRSLLILQLVREPAKPRPTCLVQISSGEVLQTASGDKSASQAVMALGVLGAMKAEQSCEAICATVLNREEDVEVRWEAARQLLGLDAKAGLTVLTRLFQLSDDPLSAPAKALRTQLMAANPELATVMKELVSCP